MSLLTIYLASLLPTPVFHLPRLISGSLLFNACVFVSSPPFMSGRTKKQKLQRVVQDNARCLCLTLRGKLRKQHGSCWPCLKRNMAGQVAWVSTRLLRGCGGGGGRHSDFMGGRGSGGKGGLQASEVNYASFEPLGSSGSVVLLSPPSCSVMMT